MAQYLVERRLMDVSRRLRKTREELAIADEQLMALAEAADEARLRSLVSETPLAAKESQEAQRHADAMAEHGRVAHRSSVWSTSSTSSWTSWYPGTPVSSHYRGSSSFHAGFRCRQAEGQGKLSERKARNSGDEALIRLDLRETSKRRLRGRR